MLNVGIVSECWVYIWPIGIKIPRIGAARSQGQILVQIAGSSKNDAHGPAKGAQID
jgi:hypothetical protein